MEVLHVEDMLLKIATHLGYIELTVLICVSCTFKNWFEANKGVICTCILRREYDGQNGDDVVSWRDWVCEQVITRNLPAFILRVLMQGKCFDVLAKLDKRTHQISTLLVCAVSKCHRITVQCLLDRKADVNAIMHCNWTHAQTTSAL